MEELCRAETWYKELQFDSLREFLEFGCWNTPSYSGLIDFNHMVFRGHSRANSYKLSPTALRLRKNGLPPIIDFHPGSSLIQIDNITTDQVIEAEYHSMLRFYKNCNLSGLLAPADTYFHKDFFVDENSYTYDSISEWYPTDLKELAALARHSGYLTRLLDWTFDLRVALYFALQGVIEAQWKKKNQTIEKNEIEVEPYYAVWCINPGAIKQMEGDSYNQNNPPPCPIDFFVPSYNRNINLKAQSGLLSYQKALYSQHSKNDKVFTEETHDQIILDYIEVINNKYRNHLSDGVMICKINLPTINALEEFRWLIDQGYHAAKLFPGYNGVVQKIEEDRWVNDLFFNK